MFQKKIVRKTYDKENQIPVIRASICTGEQVAGFWNIHTGAFEEVMLIRDEKDKNLFAGIYGIDPGEIKKKY